MMLSIKNPTEKDIAINIGIDIVLISIFVNFFHFAMKKIFFVFTVLFLPCNVFAKDPILNLRSQIRLENLNANDYQATNDNQQHTNSEFKANFISNLTYDKNWFMEVQGRYENIAPNDITQDRNYGQEGAYLRDLRFGYNSDHVLLYAGKFRPFFGIAWRNGRYNWYDYTSNNVEQFDYNNTRGVWSDYIAQNYAQAEKLGAGGVIKAGNEKTIGKYELGLAFFTNDRKNLDNSIINSRVSQSKQDAVPGDTRSLKSYVLSLDVNYDFSFNEKLFYRFAYINLDVNSNAATVTPIGKIANQKGFEASMNYQYPFSRSFNLNGLAEYVHMQNVGGNSDFEDRYLNASIVANIFRNWNLTTAYGGRQSLQAGDNGFDQDMLEFSGGYRFDKSNIYDSLLLQLAYRNLRTNYKTDLDVKNSYGILVRYIKNF